LARRDGFTHIDRTEYDGGSIMQDDFQTREWADHHASFSASVDKLVQNIAAAFAALHRQQFDAPWKRKDAVRNARCG
jgi:hypothetical protein